MKAITIALALVAANAAPALSLRATIGGTSAGLTITLFRWSTEAERTPVMSALSAPVPAPAPAAAPGRGRGGRGGAPAAPLSPAARLSASIKAAPTLGYIWSDGVTGYSIKYAWHSSGAGAADRVVLITERRLAVRVAEPLAAGVEAEGDFTVIEMRLDATGKGEGKTSLTASVGVDPATKTVALDGYAAAPALLRITR